MYQSRKLLARDASQVDPSVFALRVPLGRVAQQKALKAVISALISPASG